MLLAADARTGRFRADDALFGLIVVGMGAFWLVKLLDPWSPVGGDPGNWLALGNETFGISIRSRSIAYPPLVPLVVAVAARLAPLVPALAVIACASGLAPAVAAYHVVRPHRLGVAGALLCGLLLPGPFTTEVMNWGGYPQLLGLALGLAAVAAFDRAVRRDGFGPLLVLAVTWMGVVATSHLAAVVTAAWLAVLGIVHLATERTRRSVRRTAICAVVVIAAFGPFLPVYVRLAAGALSTTLVEAREPSLSLIAGSGFVFRELWPLWLLALIVATVSPLVAYLRRDSALWRITVATGGGSLVLVTAVPGFRFFYPLPIPVLLGLALVVLAVRDSWARWASPVLAAAFFAVAAIAGASSFSSYRMFYDLWPSGLVEGAEWVRASTPTDSVVVVPSRRGLPIGWWMEGLGQRRTLVGSDARWLVFDDERERASASNEILSAPTLEQVRARAACRGVDTLFLPHDGDLPPAVRAEMLFATADDGRIYANAAVVIIAVPDRSSGACPEG
ncbi:MAG TPA: hypothetical protein VM143_10890 [Acidimicrobiales bacterium]|nr:hypothetical protein [Acidimicrobiales bacterium]